MMISLRFSTAFALSLFLSVTTSRHAVVTSFVPTIVSPGGGNKLLHHRSVIMREQQSATEVSASSAKTSSVAVPLSWDEMVRQVASAVKEAREDGQARQIVRVLLPRDATSGDFGKYLESETASSDSVSGANVDEEQMISLVPPDESWQGGIMQLYRAAAPTGERIVRQIMTSTAGLPPRISEDRSVDESGVDGVGLLQTSDGKVDCWVQPSQESVDLIVAQSAQKATAKSVSKGDDGSSSETDDDLILLLNPQWRLVDDAIDEASKGPPGFLSGLANMLGGKGGALKQVADAGFVPVYTLEGYVCRGANVRLLQVYQSKGKEELWSVFCERDDGESFIPVGSQSRRPTYQQVEEMMNEAGIGYKYARDMGINPKL